MAVKEIKLDICNGLEKITHESGRKPTIEQNTRVEVSHNGFLIGLKVGALLTPQSDKYVGTVISLPADKEKYDDLTIGDQISFKEENICSIF